MKRRRKRNYKLLKIIFIFAIFTLLISGGYSYFYSKLNISGNIHGIISNDNYLVTPDSDPNLELSASRTGKWIESGLNRYQYLFTITNVGVKNINSFKVTIVFSNDITNSTVQTYNYIESSNTLTIDSNRQLLKNGSADVNFAVSSTDPNLKIVSVKLESSTKTEVTLEQFNVNFSIAGSSGSYIYKYDVKLTNKLNYRVSYWQIDITLPTSTSYINGSGGIFETNGNVLTVRNTSNNGEINKNSSITFGLELSTNIINFIPSDIKVTVR